jgi:hypothetical protein
MRGLLAVRLTNRSCSSSREPLRLPTLYMMGTVVIRTGSVSKTPTQRRVRQGRLAQSGCFFIFFERLPDELIPIDNQSDSSILKGSHLTFSGENSVVKPAVLRVIAQVKTGDDDLASPGWISPPIAAIIEVNYGPIFRFDHTLKIRQISAVPAPQGMIGSFERTVDLSCAVSGCKEVVLTLRSILPG